MSGFKGCVKGLPQDNTLISLQPHILADNLFEDSRTISSIQYQECLNVAIQGLLAMTSYRGPRFDCQHPDCIHNHLFLQSQGIVCLHLWQVGAGHSHGRQTDTQACLHCLMSTQDFRSLGPQLKNYSPVTKYKDSALGQFY